MSFTVHTKQKLFAHKFCIVLPVHFMNNHGPCKVNKNFLFQYNVNLCTHVLQDEDTTVLIAVKQRNIEMLKYLVEKGADVNMQNQVSDASAVLCFILYTFDE